jgi:hypothetical protein
MTLREALTEDLAKQTEHPCWAKVVVLWEQPYDQSAVWVKLGETIQQKTPREVLEAVEAREQRIKLAESDPLRFPWEHDMWRRIDLEMARKRLAHPGKVLELLVTGGIRPGKTEGTHRRGALSFLYTPDSWAWGLHQTDITSRTIQQKRIARFLPVELSPDSGKMKKDKNTKYTFTAGTGFTGAMFHLKWNCRDENGNVFEGGGEFDFRFYKQDEDTFQGSELTVAMSDELIPLNLTKIVADRLSTRAADTAKPAFLARIRRAVEMLERGESLPPPLLAAIYHSVHLISFTPAEGWSATVSHFLNDAVKYDWEISPDLKARPEVKDPRVPRFAQPTDPTKLVAYLFTSDNIIKPAYHAVRSKLEGASEAEIRIKLHGDVDRDWMAQFHGFAGGIITAGKWQPGGNVRTWKDTPCDGTVTQVIDPAGVKPWVISDFMADVAGRKWQLQEWPCPSIPIDGAMPGAWAVTSETEKRNGDAGPAQKLRLKYTRAHWTRLIWMQRMRMASKLRAVHGDKLRVPVQRKKIEWKDFPGWTLEGEFVMPEMTLMDSRYAKLPTESMGFSTTLMEAMMDEENGVPMEQAPGDSIHEGDQFIQQAIAQDILGLPGLIVLEECENTRFMMATYTLPEHREDTKAADEACKDFRDPWAYYLLSEPSHRKPHVLSQGEGEGWSVHDVSRS